MHLCSYTTRGHDKSFARRLRLFESRGHAAGLYKHQSFATRLQSDVTTPEKIVAKFALAQQWAMLPLLYGCGRHACSLLCFSPSSPTNQYHRNRQHKSPCPRTSLASGQQVMRNIGRTKILLQLWTAISTCSSERNVRSGPCPWT